MEEEKRNILKGTKFRISSQGYYGFWYPSEEDCFLEEEIEAEKVSHLQIKVHRDARWVPYKVSRKVADLYGSPIQVLWIEKRN